MTNEEAIKGLKNVSTMFTGYKPNEEMFAMAIKALETVSCIKEKCAYCPHCENCDVDDETLEIKALEQQPCEDCISRQEAINCVTLNEFRYKIVEDMKTLPSVAPKEKTGHWVKTPKAVMGEGYMWYCDKCEHQVYQDSSRDYPSEKYCPNCGAKMIEPQESEEV